jgi:hypothetical protein
MTGSPLTTLTSTPKDFTSSTTQCWSSSSQTLGEIHCIQDSIPFFKMCICIFAFVYICVHQYIQMFIYRNVHWYLPQCLYTCVHQYTLYCLCLSCALIYTTEWWILLFPCYCHLYVQYECLTSSYHTYTQSYCALKCGSPGFFPLQKVLSPFLLWSIWKTLH